jgi:hypothetical protein
MAENGRKRAIYELKFPGFFLKKLKIKGNNFSFDLALDPIKILTCWVLQNDHQLVPVD